MTGRYVIHTGIHTAFSDSVPNVPTPPTPPPSAQMSDTPLGASCWVQVLPIDEVTVAQHLRAAGYATHMVGKWSAAGTLRLAELSGLF